MGTRTRLGLYLEDEKMKRQIKVAAAKHGTTVTDYCVEAIEERLVREGERSPAEYRPREKDSKRAFLEKMDQLRRTIGPIGISASELIEEGRRR